ncbi:MAG: hypothetical protein WC406_10705, partial [Methanoregula sp.]
TAETRILATGRRGSGGGFRDLYLTGTLFQESASRGGARDTRPFPEKKRATTGLPPPRSIK